VCLKLILKTLEVEQRFDIGGKFEILDLFHFFVCLINLCNYSFSMDDIVVKNFLNKVVKGLTKWSISSKRILWGASIIAFTVFDF
jgi:hypothetical protein